MKLAYRCVCALLLGTSALFSGTTGKIAGKILDEKTNEPIIGANVVVSGTALGGATDIDGNYFINNIPPGSYALRVSAVGYNPVNYNQIRVNIDLTTHLDVKISETVIDIGKEVIITAERQLVQKDLTATTAVVNGDDIKQLPVTEISQVIELQAGNIGGRIRGGRKGETAYWIDGVPVTDAFDGSTVIDVNPNMVQELQVLSGAFNAEYGQAMSGIVNIATREGAEKYTGSVTAYGGDFLTGHSDVFHHTEKFHPLNISNIEGSVSGPLGTKDVSVFLNGRKIYFGGYERGENRFNPSAVGVILNNQMYIVGTDPVKDSLLVVKNIPATKTTNPDTLAKYFYPAYNAMRASNANGLGDGSIVPMNWNQKLYLQGKLAFRIMPELKVNVTGIMDNVDSYPYDQNTEFYTYNPDGRGLDHRKSFTGILSLTHTLSNSTFYTLGLSYFTKSFKHYLYDDQNDPRYTHPDLLIALNSVSWATGGTDLNGYYRNTTTTLGKLDVSSQITNTHFVKYGVEARRHRLFLEDINLRPDASQSSFTAGYSSPFITPQVLSPDTSNQHDMYIHRPYELSAYVQDKMEFKDLIINIGVRFDYFQPDGNVLADDEDPSIYFPAKPANRFFDYNGNGVQDPGEPTKTYADRKAYWYHKASAKMQFSPRFGASFPITDRGVVHFSYGHFFQVPNFERLYQNPLFKVGTGTGNVDLNGQPMGNADLKPEQTINGEVGLQQQLTDDLTLDLTAYLRDIRNLTGTGTDQIGIGGPQSPRTYTKYINRDFGFVRGFIVTLNKRFAKEISVNVDYTFQVARGSASDPNETRNAIVVSGQQPEVQLSPLGWDQRHTLNAEAAYTGGSFGGSIIGQFGSGQPYTPRTTRDVTVFLTNSETKPTFLNVDVRLYKTFRIDPIRFMFFLRINNIFDTLNELDVFNDTGTATKTYDEDVARQGGAKEYVNSISDYYNNPNKYSEPRRIEFGTTIEF
jgi:outer membrane receptor protein involved in Fe transport